MFWVTICLSLSLGWCIPASQLSCDSEFLRLQQGASLELHCGTHCDSYAWWRTPVDSRNKERTAIEFSGSILTKTAVEYGDGGQYMCKCLPDGAECTYTVSGKLTSLHVLHGTEKHLLPAVWSI